LFGDNQNLTNLAGYFNFAMCEKYRTLSNAKVIEALGVIDGGVTNRGRKDVQAICIRT